MYFDAVFWNIFIMKRSSPQPSVSGEPKQRRRLFTTEEVLHNLGDSDGEELEFDQTYPENDLDSVDDDDFDLGSDFDISQTDDSDDFSETRGRGASPVVITGAGDAADFAAGWNDVFSEASNLQFDNNNIGPQNIPGFITDESKAGDFLSLFFDDAFWDGLCTMTNLRAHQTREQKPNSYYAKNFSPVSPPEMKAFVGLRLCMEYLVIKPSYRDYWKSEGSDFVMFTPGFLQVMDEQDPNIDKSDKIYKVRPMLNDLLEKFKLYYKPSQHLSIDEGMIPTKNRLAIKQ